MSNVSLLSADRWTPRAWIDPDPRRPKSMSRPLADEGLRVLEGSTHRVCIRAGVNSKTTASGEWELAFARETGRIDAGARVLAREHIRFRANAAHLRRLALALLAGARELEAIDAHLARNDHDNGVDPDDLETITLTEHGVGPSYDSPLVVERRD